MVVVVLLLGMHGAEKVKNENPLLIILCLRSVITNALWKNSKSDAVVYVVYLSDSYIIFFQVHIFEGMFPRKIILSNRYLFLFIITSPRYWLLTFEVT